MSSGCRSVHLSNPRWVSYDDLAEKLRGQVWHWIRLWFPGDASAASGFWVQVGDGEHYAEGDPRATWVGGGYHLTTQERRCLIAAIIKALTTAYMRITGRRPWPYKRLGHIAHHKLPHELITQFENVFRWYLPQAANNMYRFVPAEDCAVALDQLFSDDDVVTPRTKQDN